MSGSAQTDFAGHYAFDLAAGSYTVTPTGFSASYQPTHTNLNDLTGNATVDLVEHLPVVSRRK